MSNRKIIVDVWVANGDQIVVRYTKEGKGIWGILQETALQKARDMIDKTYIDNYIIMKECGQIEISENDFVPILSQ